MSQLRRLLPSLNTLVAFEAAVRCGTFARAAKELGVTSPAVSRTIGRLELHLGVPLFHRTPSGAVLTKDGSTLFAGIAQSFGEIERTLTRLRGKRQARRPIVLSVSAAFAAHWFMPRLAKFQTRFPEEQIQFRLINGALQGPVEGVDIAMRFDPQSDEGHDIYPLMPELLVPVCSSRYAGARGEVGSFLPAAAKMITLSGSEVRLGDLLSAENLDPSNEIQLADYTLVVQAALVGQGIAVGWLNVVSTLLAEGTLVPAAAGVVLTGRRCDLVVRRQAGSSILGAIRDWILSEYQDDVVSIKQKYYDIGLVLSSSLSSQELA